MSREQDNIELATKMRELQKQIRRVIKVNVPESGVAHRYMAKSLASQTMREINQILWKS